MSAAYRLGRRLRAQPRLAAAGALLLWSGVALAWSLRPPVRLHELDGFSRAAAHAASLADAATFVVLWPPGQAEALAALPAGVHAADAVPVEAPRVRRWQRFLVIGPDGFATPPELAGAKAAAEHSVFDDVAVATYGYSPSERVLFDLRSALSEVKVRLGDLACDVPRAGGFGCPGRPEWNRVTRERLRVLGDDWPCVWAHPVAGQDLVLDLGTVRLGDRIEVEAALADAAAGSVGGAAVQVELQIDGAAPRSLWRSNAPGVAKLEAPTTPGERGVRLVVRTTHDGRRHLGVNLRIAESP